MSGYPQYPVPPPGSQIPAPFQPGQPGAPVARPPGTVPGARPPFGAPPNAQPSAPGFMPGMSAAVSGPPPGAPGAAPAFGGAPAMGMRPFVPGARPPGPPGVGHPPGPPGPPGQMPSGPPSGRPPFTAAAMGPPGPRAPFGGPPPGPGAPPPGGAAYQGPPSMGPPRPPMPGMPMAPTPPMPGPAPGQLGVRPPGPPRFGAAAAPAAAPVAGLYAQPGMSAPTPGPPGFGQLAPVPGPPGLSPAYSSGLAPAYSAGVAGQMPLVDHFETLSLGPSAPGSADPGIDPRTFPRPVGREAADATAPQPAYTEYNATPEFMRLTFNAIPNTSTLKQRLHLPLGIVVHPMAQPAREVPVVNLGSAGIVRCKRCRTYVNPFMQWTDGGRSFQCNVCSMLNTVPAEYLAPLDVSGKRTDVLQRPELSQGTVEYVAPQEYMVRPPMPPCYFFVIDVSFPAVSSGMVAVVANAIKDSLDRLPGGDRTQVGILTFDSTLHFYHLKSTLSTPQMMVVAELEDQFLPAPDDLLVNLQESRAVVDALLDSLPTMFASSQTVDSCTGPALQAAFLVMHNLGGKLLLFQNTVPSVGVGKVKNRDNNTIYGTDREYTLRVPDDPFWKKYAAEASRQQISVDVFSFSANYTDLASLGALPKYTCGSLYYYPGFIAKRDEAKLRHELMHNLTRETGWEAVMRIRCSKGLRISNFHGHFFIRSSDLLALPTVDPDKAFAVQISHEENMVTGAVAYVQCALLYTASCGERRIRVSTMMLPVVSELADLYKAADAGAIATLLAKLAVEKSYSHKLDECRQDAQNKLVSAFKEFRLLQAQVARSIQGLHNKMIYPDTLKYLPLWVLGVLKCAALRGTGSTVNADERIAVGHEVMCASVPNLLRLVYPALYPIVDPAASWGTEGPDGVVELPPTVPDSLDYVNPAGAHVLDNGRVLVVWVGAQITRDFMLQVFGIDQGQPEPPALSVEPPRNTDLSIRVNKVVSRLRAGRATYQHCFVVRQGSHMEAHVIPYFVEDRTVGTQSYADFLQTLHKSVLTMKN